MSLVLLDRVAVSDADPAVLDAIDAKGTALAIWDRALPSTLRTALYALHLDTVDDLVAEVAGDEGLDTLLRDAGYPDVVAVPLAHDIAGLLRRHAALTGEDRLAIRLEVIETDACRLSTPIMSRCACCAPTSGRARNGTALMLPT